MDLILLTQPSHLLSYSEVNRVEFSGDYIQESVAMKGKQALDCNLTTLCMCGPCKVPHCLACQSRSL